MIYAFLLEVLVPLFTNLLRNQVALVDDYQKLHLPNLSRIVKQVFAEEEQRISAVDYLDENV